MKKSFLSILFIISSVVVFAQGINFQDLTFQQALDKAKSENKYVFIDSYTDWCGPCKAMAKDIFPMKEMGDYFNPKFISVKFNAEKGEEGIAVKNRFGIKAYPTFVILDGDGNLIHMFAGGVLSLAFIDKIEESFNPDKAFGILQKKYNEGDRSKKLVANYLQALIGTYTTDATKMIEEFAATLSDDELICEECLFMFDDLARLESPRGKFLVENVGKFRGRLGSDKIDNVLKKKFEAYYAGILGRQRNPVQSEIDETSKIMADLKISNSDVLNLYLRAVAVFIAKSGIEDLYREILAYSNGADKNELDRFLYFSVPAMGDLWSDQQAGNLVTLINNEQVSAMISKNLERIRKK
ncbi:MAG: thioredoxin family protein [Bacteroidales bacterium]|nr:thioredoxin family protein [Bacteroidales bacterium]MDD3990299.1 thioredoxin family protein [Bacteroidales bacterium]